MPIDGKDIENGERLGKLETEVHSLITGFKDFKQTINTLFEKMDNHAEKTAPKPISFGMILGGGAALVAIVGAMFAVVIYISSSSNAPVLTQLEQVITNVNTLNSNVINNTSEIQLTRQTLSGLKNKTNDNKHQLDWILYQEKLPIKINENRKEIEFLKIQMNRVIKSAHNGK